MRAVFEREAEVGPLRLRAELLVSASHAQEVMPKNPLVQVATAGQMRTVGEGEWQNDRLVVGRRLSEPAINICWQAEKEA